MPEERIKQLERENKELKSKIAELYEALQPRALTEEDKKRILKDFFE